MEIEKLSVVFHDKDEWPTRSRELVADLARWYAAHPSLSELSEEDITAFLIPIAQNEIAVHLRGFSGSINLDAAGRAEHTFETSVDLDHLRLTLTSAAFERYALADVARTGHSPDFIMIRKTK